MNRVETIKIKQFKCLEDFTADVKGQNFLLVGENGLGKTSVIQFLEIAFGDNSKIPPDTTGEGKVIIDRNGEEWRLEVKIHDGKSTIKIYPPDGGKPETTKGAVHAMFGSTDFDPEKFVNLSLTKAGMKQQVVEYKEKFLPKEVVEELDSLTAKIKDYEQERTQTGRDRDTLKGKVNSNPLLGTKLDSYPFVDLTKVYEDLKSATKHNENVAKGETSLENVQKEITNLDIEIEALQNKLKEKHLKVKEIADWINNNPKKEVSGFEEQINNATTINAKHESAKTLRTDLLKLEGFETEYGEQTVLIETSRQAISDAIKDFDPPVEGLSFDDDKLLLNGIPVNPESLSESEIMLLGVKLKFAENPDFGILMLNRTESIGAKRWQEILTLCKENNFQFIGERVERGTEKLTIELIPE